MLIVAAQSSAARSEPERTDKMLKISPAGEKSVAAARFPP